MCTKSRIPANKLRRRAASIAVGISLGVVAAAPMAAIVDSGPLNIAVPNNVDGVYINWLTGATGTSFGSVPGWDFNPYDIGTGLTFLWNNAPANTGGGVTNGSTYTNLATGAVVGPAATFQNLGTSAPTLNFRGGANILGFRFQNEATAAANYGYALISTTAGSGFPATITRYFYENTGQSITVGGAPPVLQAVASRKLHGAAGPFDVALVPVAPPTLNLNPPTEPRQGPALNLVFTFDKPINTLDATFPEGTFTTFFGVANGNDVIVVINGVADQQYLTLVLFDIVAADGGAGADVSVRVGLLMGDVNQSRVVTLSDVGQVNGQLAQSVTASNFKFDINASGTLTLTDKGLANVSQTHALPPP